MQNYNRYNYDRNSESETETETDIDTDSGSDNDTDYSTTNYNQPNLLNTSKLRLLIPEIYNVNIHGKTNESDPNIDNHFMVLQSFNYNSNNNIINLFKYINKLSLFYKVYYRKNYVNNLSLTHKLIRNYNDIINHSSYLNIEIGQIYYLKGDECVCIIKTFWIKIIQRAWKKIYQIRKRIHQLRRRPDSIFYRQITGKWYNNCDYLPSFRGMLL
jgi:hypothetical protein